MIRAAFYLAASGAIWGIEGFLFSRLLGFSTGQVALTGIIYLGLFLTATTLFLRSAGTYPTGNEVLPHWRLLSLAPMLVAIVGSFITLPLLLFVVVLGRVI